MKICKKCGNKFPKKIIIEGKERNLQNRKFCLICSPFGTHNTRDLASEIKGNKSNVYVRFCSKCGKKYNAQRRKGIQCHYCYFKKREKEIVKKVQEIVGASCWLCNYDLYWGNLSFHHMEPENKLFNLSTRDLVGHSWSKVFLEMKKCVLVCCRCHGEIHGEIIDNLKIKQIYIEKWDEILDP